MYSYNVEQAKGDDRHNIVTIIMRQFNTDIHGAMQWIADYHDKLVDQFHSRSDKWTPLKFVRTTQ